MNEYAILIGSLMVVVGLPTAFIDMGMNGTRYAGWAPWGFAIAGIGLLLLASV